MKLIGAFSEIEKCLDRLSVLSMPCFFCLGCDRQQSCQVYYWRPECAQKHIKTLDTIINHMNDAVVLIVKKSKLPQDDLTELVSLASQLGKDFGVISLYIRHQGSLSQAQCEKKREAYEYAHISLHGGTLKLRNGLQEIITKCKARLVVANITKKNNSDLTDTEENIIAALGNDILKGKDLLDKAGYDYSSHYKTTLSHLVKRGILVNIHNQGYKKS